MADRSSLSGPQAAGSLAQDQVFILSTRQQHVVVILALVAMTWLLFGASLSFGYMMDDFIDHRRALMQPFPFTTELTAGELPSSVYRPLVQVSHWLAFQMFNGDPRWAHFLGVVFHLATVLTAFAVYLYLAEGRTAIAGACAALLLVHSSAASNVFWLSQRANLLCGFFLAMSMLLLVGYLKRGRWWSLAGSALASLAAFGSKELAFAAPFMALFICEADRRREARASGRYSRAIAAHVGVLLLYGVFRVFVLRLGVDAYGTRADVIANGSTAIRTLLLAVAKGGALVTLPFDTSAMADELRLRPDMAALVAGAVLCAGAILLWWLARRTSAGMEIGFAGLLFAVSVAPQLIGLRAVVGRNLYVTVFALAAVLAFAIGRRPSRLALGVVSIGLFLFVLETRAQAHVWERAAGIAAMTASEIRRVVPEPRAGELLLFATVPGLVASREQPIGIIGDNMPMVLAFEYSRRFEKLPNVGWLSQLSYDDVSMSDHVEYANAGHNAWRVRVTSPHAWLEPNGARVAPGEFSTPWGRVRVLGATESGRVRDLVVYVSPDERYSSVRLLAYGNGTVRELGRP